MSDVARERIRFLLPNPVIEKLEHANEVAEECCWYLDTSMEKVRSESRVRHLTILRHITWWVTREISGTSYLDLEELFNRQHTSIMHGCARVENLRKTDEAILEVTDLLLKELTVEEEEI